MSENQIQTPVFGVGAARTTMVWPVGALCQAIADTLQARLDACCPPSSVRLAPAGLAAAPTPTAPTTTGDSKVP